MNRIGKPPAPAKTNRRAVVVASGTHYMEDGLCYKTIDAGPHAGMTFRWDAVVGEWVRSARELRERSITKKLPASGYAPRGSLVIRPRLPR